jgi:hypothetical protein
MKFYKSILIILIVFLKTGNVLSSDKIFNVNNIEIEKKGKITNDKLANQAIKKGFHQLIKKILLEEDIKIFSNMKFSQIKELVTYYNVSSEIDQSNIEKINYNITFDKNKIHDLLFKKNISYSDISDKELFLLPILKKKDQFFIYNQNFFYNNWNEFYNSDLIEFILPLENIEIIKTINSNKDGLLNLNLANIFKEYSNKNLALILIEDKNLNEEKIYLKTKILGKNIVKNIKIKRLNLNKEEFYKKIINEVKKEVINLVKSQNLIDISIPSFLNAELDVSDGQNNLIDLNSRLKRINLIENIYVQEFNNDNVYLKIKYLGKLEKIIRQLKEQKIILESIGDKWSIKII